MLLRVPDTVHVYVHIDNHYSALPWLKSQSRHMVTPVLGHISVHTGHAVDKAFVWASRSDSGT
jgi:hypothetical protein